MTRRKGQGSIGDQIAETDPIGAPEEIGGAGLTGGADLTGADTIDGKKTASRMSRIVAKERDERISLNRIDSILFHI